MDLEKLIESKNKFDSFDVEELNFNKLKGGEPSGGTKVKIIWGDIVDYGYLFELPELTTPDELDIFVHIQKPNNSSGMDEAPPVFLHLYELLTNESVEEVILLN